MNYSTLDDQFRQAVVACAAGMNHAPYAGERLPKAADLVLTGNVALNDDGTATVVSGSHTYEIDPQDGCTCADSQHRSMYCKHRIAVELLKRVQAKLAQQGNGAAPPPPTAACEPSAWRVTEAPASCTMKFQAGRIDILLTLRDTNDVSLFERIRKVLPRILEKADGNTADPPPETPRCPIHNVSMKRYTKGDQAWYSHKAPNGSWCRGT